MKKVIRIFVGVRIEPKLVHRILEVCSLLKENLTGIRLVTQGNLHSTLKFLGNLQEHQITPIVRTLELKLRETAPFTVRGRGIGVFPDIRNPRVLWVGMQGEGLERLAENVGKALQKLGFPKEKRSFSPHLTIGRCRQGGNPIQNLEQVIDQWKDYEFGESKVEEVVLFESVLRNTGAKYSPLYVFPLNRR